MEARQLYYTSCRKGQSGSSGYQTWASSDGVEREDRREIERRGAYRPPRSAPREPSQEELAQAFPKAFRFYRLESGRWCLSLSCYTGKDYSNRWGNFFAHTLIGNAEAPSSWPIDFYEWDGWKQAMTAEEDSGTAPAPLPVLNLRNPEANSFSLGELQDFLSEEPDRAGTLVEIVRAVFERVASQKQGEGGSGTPPKAIVIRDDFLNGLFWIGCVLKAFPCALAGTLTFSTYQEDARDCADINATVEGTKFQFTDEERRFQFYMYDMLNATHSTAPGQPGDYAETVVRWMANDPDRLKAFYGFMDHFRFGSVDGDLLAPLRLFQALVGEEFTVTPQVAGEILAFVPSNIENNADAMREVGAALKCLAENAQIAFSVKEFGELINLCVAFAKSLKIDENSEEIYGLWLEMFRRFMHDEASALVLWETRKLLPKAETAKLLVEEEPAASINKHLTSIAGSNLIVYLEEVGRSLKALKREPLMEQTEYRDVTEEIGHRRDQKLLAKTLTLLKYQDPKSLPIVCQFYQAAQGNLLEIGTVLAEFFEQLNPEEEAGLRSEFDTEKGHVFLNGEWLVLLDKAKDKRQAFHAFKKKVVPLLPTYGEQLRLLLDRAYLASLPLKEQHLRAMEWLKQGNVTGDDLAQEMIQLASEAISLEDLSDRAMSQAKEVYEAAKAAGVPLRPNAPRLLSVMIRASKKELRKELLTANLKKFVSDMRKSLQGIDVD